MTNSHAETRKLRRLLAEHHVYVHPSAAEPGCPSCEALAALTPPPLSGEQEEAKRIAERWLEPKWCGVGEYRALVLPSSIDSERLARAHLALLAAYEDRSKAFERAAADCVRLERERDALLRDRAAREKELRGFAQQTEKIVAAGDSYNAPALRVALRDLTAVVLREPLHHVYGRSGSEPYVNELAEAEDEQHAHAEAEDGEQEELYVCENCGRRAPISAFNDDCRPGWTHGRLIKVATLSYAEHLREAREVEQHQEEKHGE